MSTENTNLVLVPALRFPKFEGEWERKNLGEVVKINQGLQIAISERLTEYIEGSYFYITNEFLKENSEKKFFIRNPSKSVLCTKDDILMTRTGNTGMVVTNVEGAFHNNFFKVAYPNYIDKNYLYNFLKLEKTQNQISKMAGTSTIPDLNHSDFYRIKIALPSLPEQKRIASFFTVLNQKLTQLKQKKNLLTQYKKGVMQQLFSQALRFKDDDGKAFSDWESKKLGEVGEFIGGGTPETNINEYWQGNIQWFTPTEIKSDFVSKSIRTITESGLKKSSAKLLPKGTILLTTRATIGEAAIATEECSTNQGFQSLIVNEMNSNIYIFNWIKMNKDELMKRANGSTFPEISKTEIEQILIPIPCLPEQTKIANFLSAIDDKINQTQTQIQKTEQFKKGLLQKMFC